MGIGVPNEVTSSMKFSLINITEAHQGRIVREETNGYKIRLSHQSRNSHDAGGRKRGGKRGGNGRNYGGRLTAIKKVRKVEVKQATGWKEFNLERIKVF